MVVLAVVLVAFAGWLGTVPPRDRRTVRLVRPDPSTPSLPARVLSLGLVVVGRIGLGPASRRRKARDRLRVVQALGALAAELESGQPPMAALIRAGGTPTVWPATAAAIRLDGDVVAGLGADARASPVLQQLAACWLVAASSGSGLAAAVARLATSARSAEDVRVSLETQLAGPRATARMLALLPAVGIGFGVMLGSNPLAWLLTTSVGLLCLAGGIVLTALGMWWTGRIASTVERML